MMRKLLVLLLCFPVVAGFAQTRKTEDFSTSAGTVRLTPIAHAALLLEAGGKAVYVDPVMGNYDGLPKADLILITHDHPDHLNPDRIKQLRKDSTVLLGPASVAAVVPGMQVMSNGDTRTWEKWKIDAVAAYNIKRGPAPGKFYHEKGHGNGYVLTFGGKRFYISGDTEGTPEMAALKNIDVAFICMNLPYTMSPEEAAAAVKTFMPKIAIPYHYRGSDPAEFQKALEGSGIQVQLFDWYAGLGNSPGGAPAAAPPAAPAAAPGGPAARSQQPPAQPGPLIQPDGHVTFRLLAPKASAVTVLGDYALEQTHMDTMIKDAQGLWAVTVGPLPPGHYSYWFTLDGIAIPDPGNGEIKPGVKVTQSAFEVPGSADDWEALNDVPHGDVRIIWYQSSALGTMRRMHVYLPPGYDNSTDRYPVLYLLHGGGDTDDGWISIGRANLILDNLIAEHKARPMIVVMPFAFAVPQGSPEWPNNSTLFAKDLFTDVIPYVEKRFRTLPGSSARALGGLSMPNILPDVAFAHFDQFDFLGFTGNGLNDARIGYYDKLYPGLLNDPANVKRVRFWIGDGANAMTFAGSKNLAARMKERGYQTTFVTSDGIHGWPWFRLEFYEMAQVLFQP